MEKLNEELKYIKYLLGYERDKTLLEQKIILEQATKYDYDQISSSLVTSYTTTLQKYGFNSLNFYGLDSSNNLTNDYTGMPTIVGLGITTPLETQDGPVSISVANCGDNNINAQIDGKKTLVSSIIPVYGNVTNSSAIASQYVKNAAAAAKITKVTSAIEDKYKDQFNKTVRSMISEACKLIKLKSEGQDVKTQLEQIYNVNNPQPKTPTTPAKPTTPTPPVKPTTTTEVTPSENPPPFDKPIVEVKRNGNIWKVYAFGSFPVDVTKNDLSKEFIKEFTKKIFEDPVLSKTKGNVGITLAKLRGGASNYNNGPVFPDIRFTGKNWKTFTKVNPSTSGDTKYTGRRDVNTNLALTRAQNLFAQMKTILPDIANKLSELSGELKQKNPSLTNPKISVDITPTYENYNVDTGDLNDTERDKQKYPVPGQQVYMDLTIQIEPDKVKSVECMKGLTIKVQHTPHDCDKGQYNLYVNDTLIGMSDVSTQTLGSKSKPTLAYAANGATINKYTNGAVAEAGVRIDKFTIPATAVQTFLKNSKKGEIRISGQESEPDRHAEQPIFSVTNAAGTKILTGFTPPISEKCTSEPCPKFTMVVFNPCSDDPQSAILGNNYGL